MNYNGMATEKQKLIKSLPDEITLTGISILGKVYIGENELPLNGKRLFQSDKFGWGHRGASASFTAYSILYQFLTLPLTTKLYGLLRDTFIVTLPPYGSFKVTLKLKELMLNAAGHSEGGEKTMEDFVTYLSGATAEVKTFGHLSSDTLIVPNGLDDNEVRESAIQKGLEVSNAKAKVKIVKLGDGSYDIAKDDGKGKKKERTRK